MMMNHDVMKNNWILSDELLENTPSRSDNISMKTELSLRFNSCRFILELGELLRGHKLIYSSACVILHRFFAFQSFKQHNRFIVAVACWFLAAKIEESPRKIIDVIMAFYEIRYHAKPNESEIKELQEKIIVAERIVLYTINYDLKIDHPHMILLNSLEGISGYMPESRKTEVRVLSLKFLTDSYLTILCLQYEPASIALSAMFMACLQLGIHPLQKKTFDESGNATSLAKSWYEIIMLRENGKYSCGLDEDALKSICNCIFSVYDEENYRSVPQKSIAAIADISVVKSSLNGFGSESASGNVSNKRKAEKNINSVKNSKNSKVSRMINHNDVGEVCDEAKEVKQSNSHVEELTSQSSSFVPNVVKSSLKPLESTDDARRLAFSSPSRVFSSSISPNSIGPPPTPDKLPPPTPDYAGSLSKDQIQERSHFDNRCADNNGVRC